MDQIKIALPSITHFPPLSNYSRNSREDEVIRYGRTEVRQVICENVEGWYPISTSRSELHVGKFRRNARKLRIPLSTIMLIRVTTFSRNFPDLEMSSMR